jgi:hypothetical protein
MKLLESLHPNVGTGCVINKWQNTAGMTGAYINAVEKALMAGKILYCLAITRRLSGFARIFQHTVQTLQKNILKMDHSNVKQVIGVSNFCSKYFYSTILITL